MRIIAGTARGRRLATPARGGAVQTIRPTADRAREALFSIIAREVAGAAVADLFAGTGALGLEALSRGAASALFVDRQRQALDLIRENIDRCGFADRAAVVQRDLGRGIVLPAGTLPAAGFALVFLDPPYGKGLAQKILAELGGTAGVVAVGGLVVAEEMRGAVFAQHYGPLCLQEQRCYGDTGFWFFRVRHPMGPNP